MNSKQLDAHNPGLRQDATRQNRDWKGLEIPTPGVVNDHVDQAIINAARALIIRYGAQHLTMVSVARQAKISRPTLYSRYPNRMAITREVLNREVVQILDVAFPPPHTVEALIETILTVGKLCAENDLLRAFMENDPQILVTYQYERLGKSQIIIIRFLRNIIHRIQMNDKERQAEDPYADLTLIRMDDPQLMATFVMATVQGISLQSRTLTMLLSHEDTWQDELRKILQGYLIAQPHLP